MKEKQPLQRLVESFDNDDGLPEAAYAATRDLLKALLGEEAAKVFSSYIDAVDGFFFLKPNAVHVVWLNIMEAAQG